MIRSKKLLLSSSFALLAVLVLGLASGAQSAFNAKGKATLNVGDPARLQSAVPYPGSRLLLNGQLFGAAGIARVGSGGALDPTFGTGGVVRGEFADVAVAPNGVIAAVSGRYFESPQPDAVLVTRLLPTGKPDPTFGSNGVVAIDLGTTYQRGIAVAFDRSGRILVGINRATSVGGRSGAGDAETLVAGLRPNGTFDAGFASGGLQVLGSGWTERMEFGFQRRGRVVVSVVSEEGGTWVYRLRRDGLLNDSFGEEGRLLVPVVETAPGIDSFLATGSLGAMPGGRILVAGRAIFPAPGVGIETRPAVMRLRSDGEIDRSFGKRGLAIVPGKATFSEIPELALGGGGRVFVGWLSTGYRGGSDTAGVSAFTAAGKLDRRFGKGGTVVLGHKAWDDVVGLSLQRKPGRVLAVGQTERSFSEYPFVHLRRIPLRP